GLRSRAAPRGWCFSMSIRAWMRCAKRRRSASWPQSWGKRSAGVPPAGPQASSPANSPAPARRRRSSGRDARAPSSRRDARVPRDKLPPLMPRKEHLLRVVKEQIIGVVREDSVEAGEAVADSYAKHGIKFIEITLTTPDAIELIGRVAQRYKENDIVIAAGTVRSPDDAAAARRAGAEIIVSPH